MDSFDLLVTARTATPDEYDRVIELMVNVPENGTDNSDWIEEATKGGNAEACVAYDSATDTIVASGIGTIDDDKVGCIRAMSTAEDYRGYGVGEQILNHLMGWFRGKGVARVQLHATDKAVDFYSQHGFQKDDATNMWWREA